MKKNKQKIIIMFLSVLLSITLFPFSVYADSTFSINSNNVVTSTGFYNPAISFGIRYLNRNEIEIAFCFVPKSVLSNNWGADYTGLVVTKEQNNNFVIGGLPGEGYGGTYNQLKYSSNGVYIYQNSQTDSQYWSASPTISINGVSTQLQVFNSLADVCSYYSSNWVEPSVKYPYTFQNGYLFVFDLGQSGAMYSFDLQSKSEEYSNIGSIPFPDTNQCYWFDNSLPEIDETTIPSSSATIINWSKGSKTNIFGQTQEMIATISGTSSGRYLYLYNPPVHYKWSGSSNPTASEVVNYPVIIDGVSSGDNFYIYDSFARLSDFNQGGKVTGTITGTTGYGSVSTDGAISVVTSEGAIFNQTSGGSTDISGANGGSLAENINGLKETLDNFLSQFVQLLSAPISHIRQLISASHEFLSEFSYFFDWLPSEVSGFVISAFIVMVAIGIFKLFL